MKKLISLVNTVALFLSLAFVAEAQELYVNEIVASNVNGAVDEALAHSDWFEIYNSTEAPIDIANYYLTDNAAVPTKFKVPSGFPETNIPAKGFVRIWASSAAARGPLHTSFSLSKGGEYVGISSPAQVLINGKSFGAQQDDVSFGRNPDGGPSFSYYSTPTPGSSNAGGVVQLLQLAPPSFSHEAGFYAAGFSLTLTHTEPGVSMWYSLDGSEPVDNSTIINWQYKNRYNENGTPAQTAVVKGVDDGLTTAQLQSFEWVAPFSVIDRTVEPNKVAMKSSSVTFLAPYLPSYNLYKGTTIRVKVFKEGFLSSETVTKTFFVNPDGFKYPVPVVAVTSNERSFFDYTTGMYTAGRVFDLIREIHPTGEAEICTDGNFTGDGVAWERTGNVEFFDNISTINQQIAFRVHGGCSRSLPEKSLRLYSNSEFNMAIFPEAPTRFPKRLLLRNSGNDYPLTMFRDSYYQKLFKNLTFDTQLSRPAIVFLNSEYWGIHNITERYDRYYVSKKYDIDSDEVDLINIEDNEVEEGDIVKYNELNTFVSNNLLSNTANYNTLKTMIDIDNFTDYMIAEIFAGNKDWPHKNMRIWRAKSPDADPGAPYGHDGRWRWMLYDTDLGLAFENPVAENFFPRAMGLVPGAVGPIATMFGKLLENSEYKQFLITRAADLLNTTLYPARTQSMLADLKSIYQPLMGDHIARWKAPATMTIWSDNVSVINNFMDQRPGTFRDNVRTSFGSTYVNTSLTLDVSDADMGYVKVNTIDILPTTDGIGASPYPWTGIYFQTVATKLTAIAKPGYHFAKWEDGSGNIFTDEELSFTPASATSTYKAFFEANPLPVLLKTFVAKKMDQKVVVNWATTAEKDNNYFEVERSADALSWSLLATVAGASTTGTLQQYRVVDEQPLPNINYYRLKQVDFDETESFSRIVSVNMGGVIVSNVWPNPTSDILSVSTHQSLKHAEYQITDVKGLVVTGYQKLSDANPAKISTVNLSNGLYILNIKTKDGLVHTSKFVKR